MNTWALIASILLFLAGLAGTVLPMLPGPVLIFAGMLFYGIVTDFAGLDSNFYLLQTMALIILFLVDYVSSAAGVKVFGGSKKTGLAAGLGVLVGLLILLGPLGLVIGPFAGAVLVEILAGSSVERSIRIGFGAVIGLLGGTLVKLGIEVLMILAFFIKLL